jgi:hypothetical protein
VQTLGAFFYFFWPNGRGPETAENRQAGISPGHRESDVEPDQKIYTAEPDQKNFLFKVVRHVIFNV